jgi:hypothetical protein
VTHGSKRVDERSRPRASTTHSSLQAKEDSLTSQHRQCSPGCSCGTGRAVVISPWKVELLDLLSGHESELRDVLNDGEGVHRQLSSKDAEALWSELWHGHDDTPLRGQRAGADERVR